MTIRVKVCGVKRPEDVVACAAAGVSYLGFNFFPASPRYVSPDQARGLAVEVPEGLMKVGLVVDAEDAVLDQITSQVPLDMIQLHGAETAERVSEVKARYGLPVMKVVGIAEASDVDRIAAFEAVADQILIDAKPPKGADLPGGNGLTFDWRLLAGRKYWQKPWMLAGGLTPDNVAQAVRLTGAQQVDLASGVESAPGVKDAGKIEAFMAAVQS